ncbi:MAG: GDSL-type esterase/lipase family protein [Bacteroidota bacterium]|nr:GDSL-type esterase/lipase family protein [Bacteroidota bacterium]
MTTKLLLFAAFVVSMLLMSMNHRKRKQRIVFFGDSITDQGMRSGGYIKLLQQILQHQGIEEDYELVGAGVPGDKIYDLYLRVQEDVLSKGADIVVIFIGTNDIWHKFLKLTGTKLGSFEAFYVAIIEKLLAASIKVVVCTPAVIGESPTFSNDEDEEIAMYCHVIRSLAIKYELPVVDLRRAFVNYNLTYNTAFKEQGILTADKVHLNDHGNQLVAEEMWKVLKDFKLK